MAFPSDQVAELLDRCYRRCCSCDRFCGIKIEIRHARAVGALHPTARCEGESEERVGRQATTGSYSSGGSQSSGFVVVVLALVGAALHLVLLRLVWAHGACSDTARRRQSKRPLSVGNSCAYQKLGTSCPNLN